jgi:hypothetical protein
MHNRNLPGWAAETDEAQLDPEAEGFRERDAWTRRSGDAAMKTMLIAAFACGCIAHSQIRVVALG